MYDYYKLLPTKPVRENDAGKTLDRQDQARVKDAAIKQRNSNTHITEGLFRELVHCPRKNMHLDNFHDLGINYNTMRRVVLVFAF